MNNPLILITGAAGQLGTELQTALRGRDVVAIDAADLDLTDDTAVAAYFAKHRFDIVVNCAAFTAVDAAEAPANRDICEAINHHAVATLAECCKVQGARLVHISTDYVFDGNACRPYREDDTPGPQSVYGSTKLSGERAALSILCDDAMVIRTGWLYSPHGNNFVKTMLRLAIERDELRVVVDQVGTPTSAATLAAAIVTIIQCGRWQGGIYHYSNEGVASWYDLAVATLEAAGRRCHVTPIATAEFPTAASRPSYSVLDKHKIRDTFGVETPHWHAALVDEIKAVR